MRTRFFLTAIAAVGLVLAAGPVRAESSQRDDDQYVACVVGWAAVALHQGKSAAAALAAAHQRCGSGASRMGSESADDFASAMVRAMAKELGR